MEPQIPYTPKISETPSKRNYYIAGSIVGLLVIVIVAALLLTQTQKSKVKNIDKGAFVTDTIPGNQQHANGNTTSSPSAAPQFEPASTTLVSTSFNSACGVFSLEYPSNFTLLTREIRNADAVLLTSPRLPDLKDQFSFSIISEQLANGMTLQAIPNRKLQCNKDNTLSVTPVAAKIDGNEALFIEDLICGKDDKSSFFFTIHNKCVYQVTIHAQNDSEYAKYKQYIDPLIKSFTFK